MASLYLDHDVARGVARQLNALGHDARTVQGLGLERAKDDEHLLLAAQRGWIFVTHNRKDFVLLNGAWRRWFPAYGVLPAPVHRGILVIRQKVWPPDIAAAELIAFAGSGSPLTNEVFEWRPGRGWIRCG